MTIIPKNDADNYRFKLQIPSSPFLSDQIWINASSIISSLENDQIKLRIHCIGVNFHDIVKVQRLYPYTDKFGDLPGLDSMGTVIRSNSNQLHIGDRVFGCSPKGVFRAHIIISSIEVVHIPNNFSFTDEQLAGLFVAFVTAFWPLKHYAYIRYGQTVLIHAAADATDQASIQY
ncbi:unnamed protein product [Adineta steineri]|uniref:Alcohol dehydrogenase-like N-terminal domain-containing protein n=1 Tax=Adineta steineri TaxID=433720 RepID=A0A815RDR5_9BILA|nr:unnamed protein product [Adineta steineri]CAF4001023.1 unnamed protein product [Adineta steineri]